MPAKGTRPETARALRKSQESPAARPSDGDGAADGGADGAIVAAARARVWRRKAATESSRNSSMRPGMPTMASPPSRKRRPCTCRSPNLTTTWVSRAIRIRRAHRLPKRHPNQPTCRLRRSQRQPVPRPPRRNGRGGDRPCVSRPPRFCANRSCAKKDRHPSRPPRRQLRQQNRWCRARRRARARAVLAGGASVCSAGADESLSGPAVAPPLARAGRRATLLRDRDPR